METAETARRCGTCGQEVAQDARICPKCGSARTAAAGGAPIFRIGRDHHWSKAAHALAGREPARFVVKPRVEPRLNVPAWVPIHGHN